MWSLIARNSRGSPFQSLGAATVKDLSPSVILVLPLGVANNIPADDLRLYLPCCFTETRSLM